MDLCEKSDDLLFLASDWNVIIKSLIYIAIFFFSQCDLIRIQKPVSLEDNRDSYSNRIQRSGF